MSNQFVSDTRLIIIFSDCAFYKCGKVIMQSFFESNHTKRLKILSVILSVFLRSRVVELYCFRTGLHDIERARAEVTVTLVKTKRRRAHLVLGEILMTRR